MTSPEKMREEREAWQLLRPDGSVAAEESSCVKAWARINGYKLTVEGLLGYEEQGWRVARVAPPTTQETNHGTPSAS